MTKAMPRSAAAVPDAPDAAAADHEAAKPGQPAVSVSAQGLKCQASLRPCCGFCGMLLGALSVPALSEAPLHFLGVTPSHGARQVAVPACSEV